ncbi:MAG TPA: FtsW/RodA/SpoVE family cell cycle protein [Candidatus Tyrphobacter sp.]|nr:FtsW/RodA/SpoVE family cell cycle protein [Candidatus Tyrphobacter sp.]
MRNLILGYKYDWYLLGAAALLMSAGLLVLAPFHDSSFTHQLVWVSLALLIIIATPALGLRTTLNYRWVVVGIYLLILAFLAVTLVVAPVIHGSRSWIKLGFFEVQPSEFMEGALVILFSSFFAVRHVAIAHYRTIAVSFVYFLLPALLVMLQPNLGTVLIIFSLWFSYLLVSELPVRYVLSALVAFSLVGIFMWHFGFASYQKQRIVGLFHPSNDPLGINYNVIQSKIALGSGGFWGMGYGRGTQVRLGFLPAPTNDFIFSSFIEEWGVAGGVALISLFLFLIYRILKIGFESDNNFSRFLCLGTAILLGIHLFINLGSDMGLLPVIGINLPLVSYGGSNLLTIAFLLGIVEDIRWRSAV